MKWSRGVRVSCLLTLVTLVAVVCSQQDYEELNSIDDLKRVFSEKSFPLHSLILLHWFANNVDIDNNNVVRVGFNPQADFGSHFYGNYDNLLPSAPSGFQYFTVGNVNRPRGDICPISQSFPEYVLYPHVIEYAATGRNRDRIIISVQRQNYGPRRLDQAYLTQHFRRQDNQGSRYDPQHTFLISPNLLQQLRLFSFNDNSPSLQELRDRFNQNIDDNQLNDIINLWGPDQAPLGLLFSIVIRDRTNLFGVCSTSRRWNRDLAVKKTGEWKYCELQQIHLDVITGGNGKATILWRNVPMQQINNGAAVVLFKNQMDKASNIYTKIKSSEGSFVTSVSLNEGLQARLHKVQGYWETLKEEICRGKEFQSPHVVSVTGYAELQLFVRDGKGCFRLYIKEDCSGWKSDFSESWVGLYTSAGKDPEDFLSGQWQWAIKFQEAQDSGEYQTFEYCTSTTVIPGLQARFMIENYNEKARTPMWR
ncbi:uncharacterized protein LOC110163348 [Boleophthalmus pectinirostris]|uniref:uncharacterized protein LOC110163348 n=1 Tax=Boleophthalmus pectinirostris TaxID=150288 RepID=UPI0024327964|nr:uncharacterized protein LOC110163348 [Boleophthalmus pectinirostris]